MAKFLTSLSASDIIQLLRIIASLATSIIAIIISVSASGKTYSDCISPVFYVYIIIFFGNFVNTFLYSLLTFLLTFRFLSGILYLERR